jgi:hypothetical protein
MSDDQLVTIFFNNNVYSFERASEHSDFTFGGPLERRFSGLTPGTRPLHMVARLPLVQMRQLEPRFGGVYDLPLLYGFNYSGCEIKYRIKVTGWIEILEMSPTESSEDFPYSNYPLLLPYAPLKLSGARRCTYPEFAQAIPNLVEEQPAELIVAVPPPATLGVSLWGPSGDSDDVTVVFECDLADRTVRAYNRCIT